MVDIESRVSVLESRVDELDAHSKENWEIHNSNASEFRTEMKNLISELRKETKELAGKFDLFMMRLTEMPCKAHIQKFSSYDAQFKLVWTFIVSVILSGIILGVLMHS